MSALAEMLEVLRRFGQSQVGEMIVIRIEQAQ